jgi:formamidopyrimidine-DNA glycosylase
MPELPEVESVCRSLINAFPSLVGRRIRSVDLQWPGVVADSCTEFSSSVLEGYRFSAVSRHGKYLFFNLESPQGRLSLTMVVHLRMTGRLYLVPECGAVMRHTRFSLLLDQGTALRFDDPRKFGRVWLVERAEQVTSRLGPDALTISCDDFTSRCAHVKRQLKPLLLDQSVLAGIGNIYADEILFRSGLHPAGISSSFSSHELQRLHGNVIAVLNEAVEAQGANIDGVFKAGSFVVNVYGRHGKECPVCGTAIVKIRIAQRGTHVCPVCQISAF